MPTYRDNVNDDIDLASLGSFEGADAPAKAPEPEAAPAAEPTPKAEAGAAAPAKPAEPTPAAEPPADDDDEFMDADELGDLVTEAIKKSQAQPAVDDDDETPPEVKELREQNVKLQKDLEESQKAIDQRDHRDAVETLRHSIASTAGKFKMTAEEIGSVVKYMEGNEDLVAGGMGFEEAATRRLPQLADRLRTSPAPQDTPREGAAGDGVLGAPAAGGPAAPKPWKHTVTPGGGDYSDVSRHMLETGEAASLGKYT